MRLNCILLALKAGMKEESISSQRFFYNLSCVSTQGKTCLSWQWQCNWTDSTRRALHSADMHTVHVRAHSVGTISVLEHSQGRDVLLALHLCFSPGSGSWLTQPEQQSQLLSLLCWIYSVRWKAFSIHMSNEHYKLDSDQLLNEDDYEILRGSYYT